MVIRPGFVNHWQLKKLKRLSGRQDAAEFLLRLWGACEDRRSQQFNGHAEEIAAICDYDGDPEALVGWLIECEWLEIRPEGHWVKHWEKYNGRLIANWENGQKGGRPEKPKPNPTETQITHGLTQTGVGGLREEKIGLEKIREEGGDARGEFRLSADASSDRTDKGTDSKRKTPLMTASAIKELQANPAYKGIDVVQEAWKFKAWCETKKKTQSKARFVNWLNRIV